LLLFGKSLKGAIILPEIFKTLKRNMSLKKFPLWSEILPAGEAKTSTSKGFE
jgi:hypothetical protein